VRSDSIVLSPGNSSHHQQSCPGRWPLATMARRRSSSTGARMRSEPCDLAAADLTSCVDCRVADLIATHHRLARSPGAAATRERRRCFNFAGAPQAGDFLRGSTPRQRGGTRTVLCTSNSPLSSGVTSKRTSIPVDRGIERHRRDTCIDQMQLVAGAILDAGRVWERLRKPANWRQR